MTLFTELRKRCKDGRLVAIAVCQTSSDEWTANRARSAVIWRTGEGERSGRRPGSGAELRSDGFGRRAERELCRWTDEHRAIWTHLRRPGITAHVAGITRAVAARVSIDSYSTHRARGLSVRSQPANVAAFALGCLRSVQPEHAGVGAPVGRDVSRGVSAVRGSHLELVVDCLVAHTPGLHLACSSG